MMILSILYFTLFVRCEVSPTPIDPPVVAAPDTGLLALQWERQLGENSGFIYKPIVCEQGVAFTRLTSNPDDVITCLDKETGEIMWKWGDTNITNASAVSSTTGTHTNGHSIFINSASTLISINGTSGTNDWKTLASGGCYGKRSNLINGYIYLIHDDCYPYEQAGIVRYPISGGAFDTLIMFSMVDDYELFLNAPSISVKPNGDSLLIFRLGSFNFHTSDARQDLVAYNLATRTIEWRKDDFEPTGDCNVRPVTVYDSKVYVMGKNILHCFDANTGQKLWEKLQDWGMMGSTSLLVAEGKLIVKPNNNQMIAYDPNTGEQYWKVTSSARDAKGMVYYKGHIFVTGADIGIYVHRVSDGKLVYLKNFADSQRFLYNPVAIDAATGLLFTADNKKVLCFKIDL